MGATCSYIQAQAGDGCWALAQRCGITQDQLTQYNTAPNFCNTVQDKQYVCCSAGSLPDFSPKPYDNGTCYTYIVQHGDLCSTIASANLMSADDIPIYNSQAWGWQGCNDLQFGQRICLSSGIPPFPAPVEGNLCGPQVPGTVQPADSVSAWDWALLNPCPLNACCDQWGQCGITPDFCTNTTAPGGAPGTAETKTNGCISNCGTDVHSESSPRSSQLRIGYFESWNLQRPCLNMDISQLQGNTDYSYVHFAFANITSDWQVDVSGAQDQFDGFVKLTGISRILSFGGWGFSTDAYTHTIFRTGVRDGHRQTLATNIVNFIVANNLDGVDFDWEYPGAQDLPGIPPDSLDSGANYAAFIQLVRNQLPQRMSVSMALPASFWYLKGFHPMSQFDNYVDYYVFMTYDLHGQWDWNNTFVNPGCAQGNCLRSHVNQTETEYTLSMLTKAGISSHKIVPGLAMYGRSFQMTDPSCSGVACTFTGPDSGATKGDCTDTAGYISNFEIQTIISNYNQDPSLYSNFQQYQDEGDVLIYNDDWVSWLSPDSYAARQQWYDSMNMAGSVDWALDLNEDYGIGGVGDPQDPDDDDEDWPEYTSCPAMPFTVIDDVDNAISQGLIRSDCIATYTLQTLMSMWDTAYANYTDINNGYDDLFGYYVTYMENLVPAMLENDFMWNMSITGFNAIVPTVGSGMNYFDCTLPNGVETPCSQLNTAANEGTLRTTSTPTVLSLRDEDGYAAGLIAAGLSPDWVELGPYSFSRTITEPHFSHTFYFSGFPIQNTSMVVANPKDIITKGLGDLPTLRADMENAMMDILMGYWPDGDPSDAALAYSVPVFMLMQAVDSMAQAKQIGEEEEQAEEEEEEERKKDFILLILGIVFLFVPVIGEEAASAAGLASLARAIAITGELGNTALALSETVQDPNSAIINILGMLLGVGGIVKVDRDSAGIARVGAARRGMQAADLVALGKVFSAKNDILERVMGKVCS